MSSDKTFCAAKCVNSLCDRNRIHTAWVPTKSISWADFSKDCVSYEPTDSVFLDRMPVQALLEKANRAEGLDWATGEAFHELSFKVVDRAWEGYDTLTGNEWIKKARLSPKERRGFERLLNRLGLKESMLPWKDQKV